MEDVETVELSPMRCGQRSFYGRAMVELGAACFTLLSYGTPVAHIDSDERSVTFSVGEWDCSPTTLKHVKDFLFQFGGSDFERVKKSEIEAAIESGYFRGWRIDTQMPL